ncbi:hypothetical protein JHK84_027986 [Glycine max]|nr:hypothetical protein JHK84_027986 [Glycine max]
MQEKRNIEKPASRSASRCFVVARSRSPVVVQKCLYAVSSLTSIPMEKNRTHFSPNSNSS